jgi:PfaD family protein
VTRRDNGLRYIGAPASQPQAWVDSPTSVDFDQEGIHARLLDLDRPCYVVRDQGGIGLTHEGARSTSDPPVGALELLMAVPPMSVRRLGSPAFQAWHGVDNAYVGGAMANGIASEAMVIALGQARLLGSFGAGGLLPSRIEAAIHHIKRALPQGSYAFNLLHSPQEENLERATVELYLRHGITTVEASAFVSLTPNIVRYRAAGLGVSPDNQIEITNKVMAKLSRREVARQFMEPAPAAILSELVRQNAISERQAELARQVPMADDVTVEADSGGHTDNRPLVVIFPSILALRDEIQDQYQYSIPIRVGAAGGIGTPTAALAAFIMGAAYVVTGSINQACVEAGTSEHTRAVLAQADMADVAMAPSADRFELGGRVQVLKRGTMFAMRAQKLYDLYRAYDAIEEIPLEERQNLEKRIFQKPLEAVWEDTVAYFAERHPAVINRAAADPKIKMALMFRWYMGLSSRWATTGEKGREIDYQVWCGPAIGSFNDWTRGSYMAEPAGRRVADVARHIMRGAAFLYRIQNATREGA